MDATCGWQIEQTSLPANARPVVRETKRCWTFWRPRYVKRTKRPSHREAALAALRKESERALQDLIRRRLDLPVEKRMNFLRVRLPGGGSHL